MLKLYCNISFRSLTDTAQPDWPKPVDGGRMVVDPDSHFAYRFGLYFTNVSYVHIVLMLSCFISYFRWICLCRWWQCSRIRRKVFFEFFLSFDCWHHGLGEITGIVRTNTNWIPSSIFIYILHSPLKDYTKTHKWTTNEHWSILSRKLHSRTGNHNEPEYF